MFILQETAKETAKVISTTQGLVGDFNQSKTDHVILKGPHMMHIFFVTLLKKLPATTMSVMSPVGCFKAAHNQLTRITIPTQEQVKTTT